jgi:hypothetical protein
MGQALVSSMWQYLNLKTKFTPELMMNIAELPKKTVEVLGKKMGYVEL